MASHRKTSPIALLTTKSLATIALVAAAVVYPALPFRADAKPAGPRQPKICKPLVTAKATGSSVTSAKNKSIDRWESAAASLYGASFSDLDKAQIVTIPFGFTGGRWWVVVKAKPCKPIGYGIQRGVRGIGKTFTYPIR